MNDMEKSNKTSEEGHESEVMTRMRRTFELCEVAEEIMLQNLRRRNPAATEAEIEKKYRRWLCDRPSEGEPPHFRPSTRSWG